MSESILTDEIRALIGFAGERIEVTFPWGIEREGLRTFTQAIMDRDARYWDEDFARTTRYGGLVTPPIYVAYLGRRSPPGSEDTITAAFAANPNSDGIGGVARAESKGGLPPIRTALKRVLNAGNEIEVRRYPRIGDRIFSQGRYARIRERITDDGKPMLIITTETTYTDQDGAVLCILRASQIRR